MQTIATIESLDNFSKRSATNWAMERKLDSLLEMTLRISLSMNFESLIEFIEVAEHYGCTEAVGRAEEIAKQYHPYSWKQHQKEKNFIDMSSADGSER